MVNGNLIYFVLIFSRNFSCFKGEDPTVNSESNLAETIFFLSLCHFIGAKHSGGREGIDGMFHRHNKGTLPWEPKSSPQVLFEGGEE